MTMSSSFPTTYGTFSETMTKKTKNLKSVTKRLLGKTCVKIPSAKQIISKNIEAHAHKCLNEPINSNYFSLQTSQINTQSNGQSLQSEKLKENIFEASSGV